MIVSVVEGRTRTNSRGWYFESDDREVLSVVDVVTVLVVEDVLAANGFEIETFCAVTVNSPAGSGVGRDRGLF